MCPFRVSERYTGPVPYLAHRSQAATQGGPVCGGPHGRLRWQES